MTTLAQKIATNWLASKVILAAPVRIKSQGRPHPSGARSDSKYEIVLNGDKHELVAKHDKGSWGLHTYKLLLDGTTIGWLTNHAVTTTGADGEAEFDYMERSVSNSFKRPIINDSEDSEEKVLAKAIEMMFRRGDLADAGIHKFAYGGWLSKAISGISGKSEVKGLQWADRELKTISQKLMREFATWNVKSKIEITSDSYQPTKRVNVIYRPYTLIGDFWLPADMDKTEFVGVLETALGTGQRITLRDLKRGPGGSVRFQREMYEGMTTWEED